MTRTTPLQPLLPNGITNYPDNRRPGESRDPASSTHLKSLGPGFRRDDGENKVLQDHQPQRHLHIDIQRLTLPGYSTDQQRRFTQTLQSELNRLAQEQPRWPAAVHARVSDLDAGRLQTGATPEDAARQLASRLFARLAGRKRDIHV